MLRESARYDFGLEFARIMPLNADLTIPIPTRMLGGIGPFDFSGVDDITAVQLIIKFDAEASITYTVDLSGAVSAAAVTVRELRDAINSQNPADILARIHAATNRIELIYDGSDAPDYIQIYGDIGYVALFGQGLGLKFVCTDTLKSIGDEPTLKDEETITTTDAKGLDTAIMSDGYRKGFVASVVDTAKDYAIREIMEGGHYDEDNGVYDVPTSEDVKVYFYVEVYYSRYTRGENKEADIFGYTRKLYRSCKGKMGSENHERAFADGNYTITGTTYKDENEDLIPDTSITEMTVEEYEALDLENVCVGS